MNSDRACGHWNGADSTRCGATPTRHYLPGHRCPAHTPAALAGQPEPPEGAGPLPGAWTTPTPQAASALMDNRAIASGKRRSTPNDYQAAKAATSRST